MPIIPYIPTNITVHLGTPDQPAENVTVPFTDYIKNVASGEIYPTWPENSLRANIYAIITFALNRIYTEWYTAKGYDFNITSTTAFDQSYDKDREVFENISNIVDEIFNDYIVRQGEIQPLFAQFCNGTTSTCAGLSQWGTVSLANQGLTPYEILQNYYGENINIIENAAVQNIDESYPGQPLRQGDAGNDVKIFQQQLNRISRNYPAIPKINITTGIFDNQTRLAVEKFQEIFNLPINGTVDKATWYKIKEIYNGVKRLGELLSEGLRLEDVTTQYSRELTEGMSGYDVITVQYYLNVIAYFNPNLNIFPISGTFDTATINAVKSFQTEYGLPVTGTVNDATWNKMTSVYTEILSSLPPNYQGTAAKLYPGYFLTPGDNNEDVRDLQTYLSVIAENNPNIPPVSVDGVYGEQTRDAVYTFQALNGLPPTGSVGPVTWSKIANQYDSFVNS
ncbi:MAG: peptidoglycan-binding protein [Acutalibacteraceae bacterium]|nr:peptidoglycan-binding protein [Acutalibacteraceae bacterium]